jgi:small subunit ribosomal protein S16
VAVKIRLARHGSTHSPFYRIVVADSRSPRDGRFIDRIGTYNPRTQPSDIQVDEEKAREWLGKGAQPTDQVKKILKISGVL